MSAGRARQLGFTVIDVCVTMIPSSRPGQPHWPHSFQYSAKLVMAPIVKIVEQPSIIIQTMLSTYALHGGLSIYRNIGTDPPKPIDD